jgi:hydrogenase expression/formation protein HypC
MCLAIPGKVVRWLDRDPILGCAEIEFAGVCRVCQMACVLDAAEGDYVIVHAGLAISRVDRAAAERTLAEISQLGDADDWKLRVPS